MATPNEKIQIPVDLGIIRDPNTGRETASFEIYDMGEMPTELGQLVVSTLAAIDSARAAEDLAEKRKKTSIAKISMLGFQPLLTGITQGANFVALGAERYCGVGVSYVNPFETPPRSHPVVDERVKAFLGESRYLTLNVRRLPKKQT